MTAPTLLDYAESAWSGNSTASEVTDDLNWNAAGDIIVCLGMTEDQQAELGVPTATGLTFSALSGLPTTTADSCKGYGWSATAAGDNNSVVTSTAAAGGNRARGIAAWAFSGSDGLGTPVINTGTGLTVSVTVAQADSSVVMVLGDWNATTDVTVTTSPAGGTIHEASTTSGRFTGLVLRWDNQAAGTRSYGVTAWTGTGTVTKIAVEVKGTTGGAIDLTIDNLSQAQTLEAFTFTQTHELAIANLSQAETLEAFAFTQVHELVIAALAQEQTLDNLTVSIVTNIIIDNLTQTQTLDNLTLTQVHQLVINALTQAQTLDNLALTQVHQLVIAALTQAQALDNLIVNSATNLVIANLSQAQDLDGLTLTQIHQLVIDALTQAQTLDNLTVTQTPDLIIAAITQAQTLENLALTQIHQLIIDNLTQAQFLTTLNVTTAGALRPTIDVVAVALIRALTGIPASRVDTTLPKDTVVWADGFVQAVGIGEQSGMYVPLHASLINVSCWATNVGSGKPPWGKANQLAEALKVKCLDHGNFPVTLTLSAFGNYSQARVHSAFFVTEPHRIPSDEGSFARYDGDLQIYWTPL